MRMHEEHTTTTRKKRPPVVAVLGHVDHGKSTLLDYIRKSNVAQGEAGGITQHVHAYEITHRDKEHGTRHITFIDTPGHAAFAGARARGATIADIALLIVSAEEGVKEQTKESLSLIQDAGVPYIVVLNKIDRPNANPDRVKQGLAECGVLVEGYGGNIPCAYISAKTGEGVSDLLDIIILSAELEDLTGDPAKTAEGFVLESHIDAKAGTTAVLIIKDGSLTVGDFLVCEKVSKIKRLEDFTGNPVPSATFPTPVHVYGLTKLPSIGCRFRAFHDKKDAEIFLNDKQRKSAEQPAHADTLKRQRLHGAQTDGKGEQGDVAVIPLIVKADVAGTVEAILEEVGRLETESMRFKVLTAGAGNITEGDIKHGLSVEGTVIIGFNTKPDKIAGELIETTAVPVRFFDVIYKMADYLAEEAERRRPRKKNLETIGSAKIIRIFNKTQNKQVVGARVTEGVLRNGDTVTVTRNENEIGAGRIAGLQVSRTKREEAREGSEVGLAIETKTALSLGDVLSRAQLIET